MTSLFRLEKESDADRLTSVLAESQNEEIRRRAAEIIGGLSVPDEAVVDDLVTASKEDPDAAVRAAAIDALDQREAVEELLVAVAGEDLGDEQAEWAQAEALGEALDDDQPELRMAAANVLGRIGNDVATKALVNSLDDRDYRVRARVARALGRIEDPRAVSALASRLTDEKIEVRRETAEALGRIGGGQALTALLELLDDDSETIRRLAASSLGNFGSAKPVGPLVSLLSDESDAVRRVAVFSLIEILSNAPPEKSHQLRETMVEKLTTSDHESVGKSLIAILEEGSQSHQRRNATWLLGRVADGDNEDAVQALVDVLDDDDGMTAQFAATSLATMGGETVEDALLDVLDNSETSSTAKAKAAFSLGKVGGERSRRKLDRIVDKTTDEEVRKRAFSALSKLGGRS